MLGYLAVVKKAHSGHHIQYDEPTFSLRLA